MNEAISDEDQLATMNATNDDTNSELDDNEDQTFSSSSIAEKAPDTIGMPKSNNPKPHHHEKHRNSIDNVQSHTRSPVYEVVNQPCYSPGCGTYTPQNGFTGNRWQPGRNRYGPYPRPLEQRRRGSYGYREIYPAPGYGQAYGPTYPDYGYGQRGMQFYPQDRYDRFGGYNRLPYDDYILG